ncbi:hypothetical protein ACWGNF_24760 [Streptomyces sp. NPDC055808]
MPTRNTAAPGHELTAVTPPATTSSPTPRLTFAQVVPVVAFPALGSGLALSGMAVTEICRLLACCGAIGVAVLTAASGGKRLASGLAQMLLHLGK